MLTHVKIMCYNHVVNYAVVSVIIYEESPQVFFMVMFKSSNIKWVTTVEFDNAPSL